ncbi:hypothetical protein [Streptomyces sp. NPDC093260]|uniref:hypothetical protein n=1 Tax=Streptomyces sp. NPDC093260 TaxID=3155073 RepID=UPI003441E7A5
MPSATSSPSRPAGPCRPDRAPGGRRTLGGGRPEAPPSGGCRPGDGRPDLIAYGPNGTYVHGPTGSTAAPLKRQTTTLYAGGGAKFNDIA